MAEPRPPARPYFEIQIHSSDIRRGVRYLFVAADRLRWWGLGAGLVVLFVLGNLALAPKVASDALAGREYRAELAERSALGSRLRDLDARSAEIEGSAEDLRLRLHRVYLAYGLGPGVADGQGGYPFAAPDLTESVYSETIAATGGRLTSVEQELEVLGTFLDEVAAFENAHRDQVVYTPSKSPLEGEFVLTSPFGTRRSPFTKELHFHSGLDLAASVGTPIHAPADGTVVFAGRYPLKLSVPWWRYGNLVAVRNGDRYITLFGHCDEVLVERGQAVRQGEVIARVGNTGWSTSPHLHYEVRVRDEAEGRFVPVDPRIYILDHRWDDQERILVQSRSAPDPEDFEPLPQLIGR